MAFRDEGFFELAEVLKLDDPPKPKDTQDVAGKQADNVFDDPPQKKQELLDKP